MEGAANRIRRERNNLAWLAWHIEAIARSKRMPKLKGLLIGDGKPSRPQTGDEIKAIAMMWKSVIEKGKPNG